MQPRQTETMSQPRAVLKGTGIEIPPICVDNEMLSKIIDTNDEWIRERSGIVTRYFAESGVGASDLGASAACRALDAAGIGRQDLDYLVCATMTPDHYFPGAGTLIVEKLGLETLPALDLRQQCAGFAYGMQVVDALIRSGMARTVLLVGSDVHTALMPFSDEAWDVLYGRREGPLDGAEYDFLTQYRHLLVLFGDATGAMVFEADEGPGDRGIVGSRLMGDGRRRDVLYVPGGGSAYRPWVDADMIGEGRTVPHMDGRQVFKLAVTKMPRVTRELLEAYDLGLDDLDLLVMHQANLRINEAAQRALGLPSEKVHNNIQKYGNTTSATLPLCFHEAREEGKAPEGSLVAFTALGAGLHWGSVLLRV